MKKGVEVEDGEISPLAARHSGAAKKKVKALPSSEEPETEHTKVNICVRKINAVYGTQRVSAT